MLESELFGLLEQTTDAAYTVTTEGEVRSWNTAAERLFGYTKEAIIGKDINAVLDARDDLGTAALAGGQSTAARPSKGTGRGIPHFDLEVRAHSGERIWINVSTIVYDDSRTGERLFVRLARDVSHRRRAEHLATQFVQAARDVVSLAEVAPAAAPVAELTTQERRILRLFAQGRDASTIARRLAISAQTLRNHLHRINRKLRTHNRLEAVTHALRRGLLD